MRISRCLFALPLLAVLAGCQPHHTGEIAPASTSSTPSTSSSEAERTREMERKAADIEKREANIKDMVGSDQEKIDATNQLEKERQALANQADSGKEPGN
jgi:hypothetical protein